jgi:hypothetical protein
MPKFQTAMQEAAYKRPFYNASRMLMPKAERLPDGSVVGISINH